eukprot:TRINITY_DN407_c0_g4_i1.p1 TRINITY_DN407_c0_g4~~TRINITY_DN407_c0_g4_i1.p1  ORF type:complete len:2118 (+),score=935.15 TRINITY_DN407_c0_g4_i1:97-6450(+)
MQRYSQSAGKGAKADGGGKAKAGAGSFGSKAGAGKGPSPSSGKATPMSVFRPSSSASSSSSAKGSSAKGSSPPGSAGGHTWKPIAVKREASPSATPPVGLAKKLNTGGGRAQDIALRVSSNAKNDEIGISTLVGDYKEQGLNHGRKYYQKVQMIPGHEKIKVYLYYWDKRDGEDFSGWWFGDELGGSQVWARVASHGPVPPRSGWKVPWDAPKVEPGLLIVESVSDNMPKLPGSAGSRSPSVGSSKGSDKGSEKGDKGGKGSDKGFGKGKDAAFAGYGGGKGGWDAHGGKGGKDGAADAAARCAKATKRLEALERVCGSLFSSTAKAAENPDATKEELQKLLAELQKKKANCEEESKTMTIDAGELRKGGAAATQQVSELSKLSARLRKVQTGIAAEITKVKTAAAAAPTAAEASKKNEEKDKEDFEAALPESQQLVADCEDAAEALNIRATHIEEIAADDPSQQDDKALLEIEKAAQQAAQKITSARKQIDSKLTACRKYAQNVRKQALEEFSSLQAKLTEAQKLIVPYKSYKRDYSDRLEAKKALSDISSKLDGVEIEAEKAAGMTASAGDMSEEDVSSADKVVSKAMQAATASLRQIDQRMRGADAAMRKALEEAKARANKLKKQVDAVASTLKSQRESITIREAVDAAKEKLEKVEAALAKCADAEMPFLKGIEVLPADESGSALSECEKSASDCGGALQQAQSFVRMKLSEVKRFSQEGACKPVIEELVALQQKGNDFKEKLETFKKETTERKRMAVLAEAVEKINDAESKVEAYKAAAGVLMSGDLEATSVEAIKAAAEKAGSVEKEASQSVNEAKKAHTAKMKEVKDKESAEQLKKLSGQLQNVQSELSKIRKAVANADKACKAKELLEEQGEKLKAAEEELEKAESIAKPSGEEKPTDEAAQQLDELSTSAGTKIRQAVKAVEAQLQGAPGSVQTALKAFLDRCKAALKKTDALRAASKGQLERIRCEKAVKECKSKVEEAEAGMEKVSDAEAPFLKGMEVLPLQEAETTLEACEKAAAFVQSTMAEARTMVAAKNVELKVFDKAISKPALEELSKITDRVNTVASKLASYKKDSESRKKQVQLQQAEKKVADLDAIVQKALESVKPFQAAKAAKEAAAKAAKEAAKEAKEGEEAPAAPAPAVDETGLEGQIEGAVMAVTEAKKQLTEVRQLVAERLKAAKTGAAPQKEGLEKLQASLQESTVALADARGCITEHEQKFTAKAVLAEASEKVATLEELSKKAAAACAKLLDQGGEEFLVSASIHTLVTALREHMQEKGLSEEPLFKEVNGGKDGNISEAAFLGYLAGLPKAMSKDELTFAEARQKAIFAVADADKDGAVSLADLKALLCQRYRCTKGIAITDNFDIQKSKTVGKAEPGDIIEVMSAQNCSSTGAVRVQCRHLEAGVNGWITMKGNQGSVYLTLSSPFQAYCDQVDKDLSAVVSGMNKVKVFVDEKIRELGKSSSGPLAAAKADISKHRTAVNAALAGIDILKKKMATGKKDYKTKEMAEKNAHLEAREKASAEEMTKAAAAAVATVEAASKAVEQAAEALTAITGDEAALAAFSTPSAVKTATDQSKEKFAEATKAAKETLKGLSEKCGELMKSKQVSTATSEAKKEVQKCFAKMDAFGRTANKAAEAVKKVCDTIADSASDRAACALLDEVQNKGVSVEKLFEQLAAGGASITSKAFAEHLASLEGLKLPVQHGLLLADQLGEDGLARRGFVSFVQRYFKVVKDIAITDVLEVGVCKTLRKAGANEIIQVLEGPKTEPKLGFPRLKGKSLIDGAVGWISVKGNQGTPFLVEAEKPFYVCLKETPLEASLEGSTEKAARSLRPDEVVELLEGPCKVTLPDLKRMKVKATKDGASGWITVRDRAGAIYAEATTSHYKCTTSVAITDKEDVKDCKVVRKLAVGEVFLAEAASHTVSEAGITRVRGKATQDGAEGWITLKGNAGTTYAEADAKLWSIIKEAQLQNKLSTEYALNAGRALEVGETCQVLEGPKEEKTTSVSRIKARSLSDGAEGWVTQKPETLRKFGCVYRCSAQTPLHDQRAQEGATVLRQVANGESLELLDGPFVDATGESKESRMRARCGQDGAIGWVTIRNADGKVFMK